MRVGGWIGVVTTAPATIEEITPGFWGGAALGAALAPLRRAAATDLPIILEGETGTGKEMVAGALHRWSGRGGPLVAVNCAALPEALAEGELFGYRRGAFTGADRANPGFFRSADGGTLLLDEISDLPLALQAKLLRVLEQREVHPLGEARPVPVDVRVVVAGQQSLMESARTGRFRPDLLARLDGLTVKLPPLRARREDVVPLFSRFLETFGRGRAPAFESDLAERLCVHDWPFNVRELVLLTRRLLALHEPDTTLRAHHLPERIGQDAPATDPARRRPVGHRAGASRFAGFGAGSAPGAGRGPAHGQRQRRARGGHPRHQPPARLSTDGRTGDRSGRDAGCRRQAIAMKAVADGSRVGEIVGGKYRIVRLLAKGGMGVVYEAQHTVVRRRFAIKFLRRDLAERRDILTRFQREAEAAGALENENVTAAVDFGVADDGTPYILMEYLVGQSLAALLEREGSLTRFRAPRTW